MPPKRKFYPDYCYETVTWVERGSVRTQKYPIKEKMEEYDRKHDQERIQSINQKQKELIEKQKEVKKANTKKKSKPKKKKKKKEEEETIDESDDITSMNLWRQENKELKKKEKELVRIHEELEELLDNDYTDSQLVDEEEELLERLHENYNQLLKGNNTNQEIERALRRTAARNTITIEDEDDDDDVLEVPMGESIYQQRKEKSRIEATEEKKKLRRSNYMMTVATNIDLQRYTEDEVEIIARELQERLKGMLYYYAPDYIRVLTENDDLDLIEDVTITIKTEMQESRGKHGQLHSHMIVATSHYTQIQLDYDLIHRLIQEIAKDFGFQKKDGSGIAKFQVQIQRASDSAQNEYDYLAEDGITYEAGDISEYYERAEEAIKDGSMDRSELRSFRRRKKEVASAQKTVRELRGQRFNF